MPVSYTHLDVYKRQHLKRYIYERAELEEPFSEVPQEVYKEIVVDSFKAVSYTHLDVYKRQDPF